MKRPYLFNLMILKTKQHIALVCSVALGKESKERNNSIQPNEGFIPSSPLENLAWLGGSDYKMRLIGMNHNGEDVLNRVYESDSFGNFDLRIPIGSDIQIERIHLYEISIEPGVEMLLGSYIPQVLNSPLKMVISDFDKTLVDTRYSTPRELYISLSKPVTYFPVVPKSVDLLKSYIEASYQPFILSASPHFYETAMRDWLYLHQIYTNNILLKDYRKLFSLFDGELSPKDLKTQGFYKINNLVNLLLMTGIPEELVLMGDGFESDPLVYMTLATLLQDNQDPWNVWNQVKKSESFKLTTKQNVQFLSKFYQLSNLTKNSKKPKIIIHIRCRDHDIDKISKREYSINFIKNKTKLVEYYVG